MRVRRQWILVCLCLLLTGCAGKQSRSDQEALDFRTALLNQAGCSFTARLQADYGEKVYAFSMDCQWSEEQTRLMVTEPASIAGIAAVVSEDGTQLAFDGVELDFGELANGYVSPVTVPWLLAQCWMGEYIAWTGADGDQTRVTYLRGYEDKELTVDTWFSDGIPAYAEISYDGARCITAELMHFQMTG